MTLIKDTQSLFTFCKPLHETEFITVDTEFMREKTYWPELCLIQVAGPESFAAIDPQAADIELTPLFNLLNNANVTKVFHAARQDLEIFLHLMDELPKQVFDTQIAAMVCGFGDSIGYDTLVSQILKKKIDKTSRFTNWSNRPLSKKQINYAISDVTYLFDIYPIIRDQIIKNNRENWLKEELAIITSKSTYDLNPDDSWKRLKIKSLNKNSVGILVQLSKWREKKAQEKNLPRGNIIRDEVIYEVCSSQPKNDGYFNNLRSFNRKGSLKKEYINEILQAVKDGKSMNQSDLPIIKPQKRLPTGISSKISILKILLDTVSEQYGVAQKLIANRNDLQELILDDKANVKTLKGWRYEIFGKKALDFKNGKIAIKMKDDKVLLEDCG